MLVSEGLVDRYLQTSHNSDHQVSLWSSAQLLSEKLDWRGNINNLLDSIASACPKQTVFQPDSLNTLLRPGILD